MVDPPPPRPGACLLPFPEKFHAAVRFVEGLPDGACGAWRSIGRGGGSDGRRRATHRAPFFADDADVLSDDAWLALSALANQATRGPCAEPRPWAWDGAAAARWAAWSELGGMAGAEAMRLYVRVLDDESPGWWLEVVDGAPAAERPPSAALAPAAGPAWETVAAAASPDGAPCARYEHATALLGASLLVAGGSAGGRPLGDTWALDLESLAWARLSAAGDPGALPARSGAAMLTWRGRALVLGGHRARARARGAPAPPDETDVWELDARSGRWARVPTAGDPPPPRGGHTATRVGGRAFVVGGESRGRTTSDVWILHLDTLTWRGPVRCTGRAPAPRSGHAAAARGRFVVVAGGADGARVHADVAVLDTETLEWAAPAVVRPLPARAGGAAATVGDTLVLAGGGDLAGPVTATVGLDLTALPLGPLQWRVLATAPAGAASPAASEGLALARLPATRALLAHGGNAGRLHSALALLRLPEEEGGGESEGESGSEGSAGGSPLPRAAAASPPPHAPPPAAAAELVLMRRQLGSAQAAAADAEARADAAGAALAAARDRVASLEAAAADAARAAAAVDELRAELEHYKRAAGGGEGGGRQGGGLWRFVAGA